MSVPEIFRDTLWDESPAGILRGIKKAAGMNKRYVGFHPKDLKSAAKAWDRAAIACAGERSLVEACLEQRDRYRAWLQQIMNDIQAADIRDKRPPAMLLERGDWPHPAFIDLVIARLDNAQIRNIA